MTTQVKAIAVGDPCLVYRSNSSSTREQAVWEGKVKKVTATGQLTIDCGVWPATGAPILFRFKPSRWGTSYEEIGASRGTYMTDYNRLVIGPELDKERKRITRENAIRGGAFKIKEKLEALRNIRATDRVELKKAANALLDAITKTELVESLDAAS